MIEIKDYDLIFAENQEIETERLRLRPITLKDAEDMFLFASDEKVTKFIYDTHTSVNNTKAIIASVFMREPFGKYGIELKENSRLIGTIDLRVDKENVTGEVGYSLSADHWRKGYTTEAARALLKLGFEQMKLVHIMALYNENNPASGGVMKKVGMLPEGRFPNFRLFRGEPATFLRMGLTRDDWKNQ